MNFNVHYTAGQMHEAGTNHSRYALPVYARNELNTDGYLPPLSRMTIRTLLEEHQVALSSGFPLAIAIDEVSMLDAITFGRILRRIDEFQSDYFDNPPPRLFILVGNFDSIPVCIVNEEYVIILFSGDFFQIPPVRATSLYSTVLDIFLFKKLSIPGGPEEIGQRFFSSFQLYRLDKQHRSLDSVHSANLESLRTLNPAVYPFTKILLSQYKKLQPADVIADPEWLLAPVIVLFNKERRALNLEGLKIFAKAGRFPIISWRYALHGTNASLLTAAETNNLYATHPALSGFFVPGAPAYGRVNTNTTLGLYNGTKMILHSLTLHEHEDRTALNTNLGTTPPGEVIVLSYPPYSVQVEIVPANPDSFSQSDSLVDGAFVVPILVDRKSNHEGSKAWELLQRNGRQITSIKYRAHAYELGFSITCDKCQSKSFRRLILDLQLWPKMSLTAEKLLVGLSRVQMLDHLRILPYGPGQNEQHLYCLKPNQLMLHWFAGFNESGIWSPQGSAASIQKHPLTSTKKRASTSTGSTKRQPSNKSSAPPTLHQFWSLQAVTLVTHSSHCIYSPSSAEASFHVPEPCPLAWIPQDLRTLIEVFAAPQPPPKGLKSSLRSTDVLMHNCFSSGTCLIMLPQYKCSTETSTKWVNLETTSRREGRSSIGSRGPGLHRGHMTGPGPLLGRSCRSGPGPRAV